MAPESREAKPAGLRLAVCGHTNLDVQLMVQELPKAGQSAPVLERRTVWGGTAANIARHAGGLGVPVRLWSRVGADFPDAWRDALAADGVDLAHLDVVATDRTPTCFVLTGLIDRQAYCMDQGPMATMAAHPPSPRLVEGFGPGDWLHVATGEPQAYAGLMAHARKQGVSVAFDPGQELRFLYDARTLERLLGLADVYFCNEAELQVAYNLTSYGDPVQLLDHVEAVVVTRGAQGASLYRSRKKPVHLPAQTVQRVIDPTGAGDALRAGWYAALRRGQDFENALRWGQAAGAAKVQVAGPQSRALRPADLGMVVA
jgi:sugar/nucleoside kinase (ribokinase family)